MTAKQLIDRLLKSTGADIAAILDDHHIAKAGTAAEGAAHVTDAWDDGQKHGTISGADTNTGPAQRATGGNVGKMTGEYSDVAPQGGTQADAERFLAAIGAVKATAKAIASQQNVAIGHMLESVKSLNAVVAAILAKAAEEEPAAKADDEDEFSKAATVKASDLITQAKALLAKAESLRKAADEMDGDDEKEAAKAIKSTARAAKKSARIALGKARTHAYVAGSVVLKKAIIDICAKADIDPADDDEINKAEEADKEAAKAAPAAAAAATAKAADDPALQADHQDPANGNQAAAAKSVQAQLADALAGITVLTTTVKGLMDTVGNTSRGAFAKAAPVALTPITEIDIYDRIEKAMDLGMLTMEQSIVAESIAQQFDAVAKGRLDKSVLADRIAKADAAVQSLYADAV